MPMEIESMTYWSRDKRLGEDVRKLSSGMNILKSNPSNNKSILDIEIFEILMFGAV